MFRYYKKNTGKTDFGQSLGSEKEKINISEIIEYQI